MPSVTELLINGMHEQLKGMQVAEPVSANSSLHFQGAATERFGGGFDRVMLGGFLESAALWCFRC
jgi:hypothetical protein